VLVAAVGVLASLATSALVYHWESDAALERLRSRFQIEARERVVEVRQELDTLHQALRSVSALFHASETVTREEFRVFAGDLMESVATIRALGWIPHVGQSQRTGFEEQARREIPGFRISERDANGALATARLRDEYFPVYFVEARGGNGLTLGFDLASDAVRREALQRARRSSSFAASEGFFLGRDAENQTSVIGYLPVYRKGAIASSEARHRPALEGFVVVECRIGELVEHAITRLPDEGIDVWVFDATSPASPELLYVSVDPVPGRALPSSAAAAPLRVEDTLDVGGRRWEVISELASGAFVPPPSNMARLTLLAGLLITGIIAWYLRSLQRYGLEMERANLALDREVAEHRQTANALRKSEQRARQILESAADAILISGGDGCIQTVNKQAERLFGYARHELIGQPVELLLPDQLREKHAVHRRVYYAHPRKRPVVSNQELSGRHRDGSLIPLEISLSPSGRGEEQMVTAIIRDISVRKAAEAELRRLNRNHAVLSRSSSSLARSVDAEGLLTAFCTNVVEVGGYCFAWVGYAQEDGAAKVRIMAYAGRVDAGLSITKIGWSELDEASTPCGTAIRTGRVVVLRDIEREPQFELWRSQALQLGYRSMIALPLKSDSHTFGNFSIFSAVENAFNDKEVELLMELAEDLSFGIQTLRARSEHERRVRLLREEVERETRKRIAAILHDGVAQTAQAVNLGLKRLRANAAKGGQLEPGLLDQVILDVRAIISDLRELSHELRPLFLERMTLIEAVRHYCGELSESSGINVRVSAQDVSVQVGQRVKEQCFLSIREALNNAIKHAGASRIDVLLDFRESEALTLRIADDGAGFDPIRVHDAPKGLGLSMISERAESIGGTAQIRTAPGKGTTVTISVPLSRDRVAARDRTGTTKASVQR